MANLLLSGALILLLFPTVVNAESHWESYADWAMGYTWSCYPYQYTNCTDWYSYPYYLGYVHNDCTCGRYQPYSQVCNQATGWNCYTNCLGWILVTRWRCQNGWKGANCDIPICDNPVCSVDQMCVRPFTCECPRSPNGECIYQPCDDGPMNCYPGFCDKSGYPWKCICPAGFKGPNCQTITNTPEIKSCYVQIFGTPDGQAEQEVARANECAASGLDPLPVWIGQRAAYGLTKIVVNWEAHYVNQLSLPGRSRAPYILNAPVPIGIVETNFTVSFPNETRFAPSSTFCIGPDPVYENPPTIKQCNGLLKQWSDLGVASLVKTNASFVITIEAQVGGVKKGDNYWSGGRFTTPQRISMDPSMNTTIRRTTFAFDLEPPYHCLSKSTNCSVFPILLNRSMTSDPVIQPTFNDWNDDASGIDRFYVEVYYMQPNSENLLVPVGAPLKSENVNITLNNFRFTCPIPGAYSIVLTVYDKANNSAKARKIFNYDNHDSSFYETTSPIHLSAADPNTDYKFITRLERPADGTSPYQFNVIWDRHFANTNNEDWLRQVRPWPIAPNQIDDNRGSKYGLRSIDSLTRETGVSGYELAYAVDNRTSGVGAVAPSTFTVITERSTTRFPISISSTLKHGDTIVVWLRVHDLYGKSKLIVTKTYVDTSRFSIDVKKQEFVKHFPEQFNSSVVFDVVNKISGIKNITYEIYDTTRQLSVRTGTVLPEVLEAPSAIGSRKRSTVDRPCLSTDPTCYCIPLGYCYNRTQLINIDNCWLYRVAGDEVRVKYTIYSLSGWGLDAEVYAGTLSQEDIPCRSGAGSQSTRGPPGQIGATAPPGGQGQQGNTGPQGPLGATGYTGIQGPPGWTGATGPVGWTGLPGATGGTGNTGSSGSSGATGPVGSTGPLGLPGRMGLTGYTGYTGPVGSTGPSGNPGVPGNNGATGQTGGIGATGITGPSGGYGATGAVGRPGQVGPTGPQGYKGDTGYSGRDGGPGPAGSTGAKGDPGADGTAGRFGATGATGLRGSPGLVGPPGPPGQGAAGLSSDPENPKQPQSQEPSGTSLEVKYGLIAIAVVCAVNFLLVIGLTLWSRSQRMKHAAAAADTEIQDADDFDTKSQSCDVSHDADQVSA